MKKYWWLAAVFAMSCKKPADEKRIVTRLQPSSIAVTDIDVLSGRQTPLYKFVYYYNETLDRFDSIVTIKNAADSKSFTFDYSQIDAHRILLNYTDTLSYAEYIFS